MSKVIVGIDRIEAYDALLKGKRVGLLTSPAAVMGDLTPSIDFLHERYNLSALIAPEHGVRGDAQAGDKIADTTDALLGIVAYTLYDHGGHRMSSTLLDAFDVLVYDIQDVGSRFYTFLEALRVVMEACAKAGKPVVLMDRPNPVGDRVEGNLLPSSALSIVGCYEMPQRYGLTAGEIAMLWNEQLHLGCDLHVIAMQNYKRSMLFDESAVTFINPSPNLPNLDAVMLYNGTCLFEGTNLSEGRGTTRPFEVIGAPGLPAEEIADVMNAMKLDGVHFRPTYFTPTFSKHQGALCAGVQIHLLDRRAVRAVEVGIRLLAEMKMRYEGDFWFVNEDTGKHFIDRLLGTSVLRDAQPIDPDALLAQWGREAEGFAQKCKPYHLYA